jgi:hypothetical protein
MKLFTQEIIKKIPKIGTQSEVGIENLMLYCKLFTPWTIWTWYIAEADFETGEAFGLVCGFEKELGYFSLDELKEIKGHLGLKIERDLSFEPCKYSELMKKNDC